MMFSFGFLLVEDGPDTVDLVVGYLPGLDEMRNNRCERAGRLSVCQ
jgi:hypothetical protein